MRISAEFRMVDNRIHERNTQRRKHEMDACIYVHIYHRYIYLYIYLHVHILQVDCIAAYTFPPPPHFYCVLIYLLQTFPVSLTAVTKVILFPHDLVVFPLFF